MVLIDIYVFIYCISYNLFLVEKHQARQRSIIKVQDEIQRHQQALLDLVKQLNTAREGLEQDLTEASKELKAIRYAEQCKYIQLIYIYMLKRNVLLLYLRHVITNIFPFL